MKAYQSLAERSPVKFPSPARLLVDDPEVSQSRAFRKYGYSTLFRGPQNKDQNKNIGLYIGSGLGFTNIRTVFKGT